MNTTVTLKDIDVKCTKIWKKVRALFVLIAIVLAYKVEHPEIIIVLFIAFSFIELLRKIITKSIRTVLR